MIWVDTNIFLLGWVWKLTTIKRPQLMMALQVRPAPDSAVDDMRQALTMCNLSQPHSHSVKDWNIQIIVYSWNSLKTRLRPIPVLGIGIGPIPVVSVWYRYRRYCSRYQNRYQWAVTPLQRQQTLFTRSRKWSYIDGATEPHQSLHINWIGASDNYNPPYPTVRHNGQCRPVGRLIR